MTTHPITYVNNAIHDFVKCIKRKRKNESKKEKKRNNKKTKERNNPKTCIKWTIVVMQMAKKGKFKGNQMYLISM